MTRALGPFFAALTFLTRLPAPRVLTLGAEDFAASFAFYPVVGALVGALGAIAFVGANKVWGAPIAATFALAAMGLVTGALHEDALADAFDGFGGGRDVDSVLRIMKDSRIGSFGAYALVLVTAARLGLLTVIDREGVWCVARAMITAHAIARWTSVVLLGRHAYVRTDASRSGAVAVAPSTRVRMFAGATALFIALIACGLRGLIAAAIALVLTRGAGRYFERRIGGVTGDCLGAVIQLSEITTLLVLAAA